ncbi:MAG: DHHA1 domain-containing protein, partial [Planctomycetales bacterium]
LPQLLNATANVLNVAVGDVRDRFEGLLAERGLLEKQLLEATSTETVSAETLLEKSEEVAGVNLIVADVIGGNAGRLRSLIDQLRREDQAVAVLLASRMPGDKVLLVAGISDKLIGGGLDAGRWVGAVAKVVGGGGGGKPGMAQAGGRDATKIPEALETAKKFARSNLEA